MAEVRRVGESFRPWDDQISQAQAVAERIRPVRPSWQDVLRDAIDRGLREIEAELPSEAG